MVDKAKVAKRRKLLVEAEKTKLEKRQERWFQKEDKMNFNVVVASGRAVCCAVFSHWGHRLLIE